MVLSESQLANMRAAVVARLPDAVQIQAKTTVGDGAGGWSETWATVASGAVSGRVDPLTARDKLAVELAQERIEDMRQLTVPFDAPLDEGERVLYNSEAWEIVSRDDNHSWNVSRRAVIIRSSTFDATATAQTYDSFITALSPLLQFKFTEASGNILNHGSLGGVAEAVGAITYGYTDDPSPLGRDAVRMDASNEYIRFTNIGSLDLQAFSFIITVKWFDNVDSFGRLYEWGDHRAFFDPTGGNNVQSQLPRSGGQQNLIGSNNQLTDSPPADWLTLVLTASGGTLTMYTINASKNLVVSDADGSGALDAHGGDLVIANRVSTGRQVDMAISSFVYTSTVLTAVQVATLRNLIYGV